MTTRTRTLGLAVTAAALTIPAPALAAHFAPLHRATDARMHALAKKKKTSTKLPVVTSVSPKSLAVGGTLTIHGRNFLVGRGRNTVVFQRQGGRYVFVKSGLSTSRTIWVKIPSRMTTSLTKRGTARAATRFRLRILTKVFGKSFTPSRMSPVISPAKPKSKPATTQPGGSTTQPGGGTTTTPPVTPEPTCDASGKTLPASGDADKDGLPNSLEVSIHTNPCLADTDNDSMPDFWEYKAALDYNSTALPYPGKRPYPNALDPRDLDIDHDGDGLTAGQEERLWAKFGNKDLSTPLFMSDGTQSSVQIVPVAPGDAWASLDIHPDGILTDDERDSDLGDPTGRQGDGLGNWDEANGRMNPDWWTTWHPDEAQYGLSEFQNTDYTDPDTDGDGVRDGADDVDHDGYSNKFELSRDASTYWVQPFNPCLPSGYDSPIHMCSLYIPADPWPPFDRPDVFSYPTPWKMEDIRQTVRPTPLYDWEIKDPNAEDTSGGSSDGGSGDTP